MLKLKEILLNYGFKDNKYLDEYVELILNNYDSSSIKGCTQKHYVIPASYYNTTITDSTKQRAASLRAAKADPNNYKVNLKYSDHVKAHWLLCQCSPNIIQKVHNITAYTLMLSTLLPAVVAGVVQDLETSEEQQLAYEFISSNTLPLNDSFQKREDIKLPPPKFRHKANTKVRCIETGVIYKSIRTAEIANGLVKNRLNSILSGHRKQIPGMTFEYYTETSETSETSEISEVSV